MGGIASRSKRPVTEETKTTKDEMTKTILRKTGVVYDTQMELHFSTRKHPERPERIKGIFDELTNQGLYAKCVQVPSKSISDEELLVAHTKEHIEMVCNSEQKSIDREADYYFTNDTYANPNSSKAAHISTGSLWSLTEKVVSGELENGFAIIRPPGHHAERGAVMGFCYFNNVAVAAKLAIAAQANIERVLIVDWDVHHGNGTQNILNDDPNILYFSVHQYEDKKFYPGTGAIDEVGVEKGTGYSVNVPWNEKGMGDGEYLACFQQILSPIAKEFKPDLILVSAGFDCAKGDPIGDMEVTTEGFGMMTQIILSLIPNGKVVLALEGGYNIEVISQAAAQCVKVLLGIENPSIPELGSLPPLKEGATKTIEEVIQQQKNYWKCFEGL